MSGLVRLSDGKDVIVRYVTAVDETSLFNMFSSMRGELVWSWPPYTRDRIRGWMQSLDTIHVGAEWGSQMAGYAAVSLSTQPRRRGVGQIEFYVHPSFQKEGLGTILVKELLEAVAARRIRKVNADVPAENKAALRLLQKVGFQHEGVRKEAYYGVDEVYHDLVLMGVTLKVDL